MSAGLDVNEPSAGKDLTGCGTVLLVEDEHPVRKFGARALRNKGYNVVEAESGEAAREVIRNTTEKIDLLITDVVMPRLDTPGLAMGARGAQGGASSDRPGRADCGRCAQCYG